MPTHGEDQLFSPAEQVAGGWIQLPITWVALVPPTEYPDQFVLVPRPYLCLVGWEWGEATPAAGTARAMRAALAPASNPM